MANSVAFSKQARANTLRPARQVRSVTSRAGMWMRTCAARASAKRWCRTAEEWARAQGLTEMASDTWLENEISLQAHLKMGYEEAERSGAFCEEIVSSDVPGRGLESRVKPVINGEYDISFSTAKPANTLDAHTRSQGRDYAYNTFVKTFLIYGSYGYTGNLIAELAVQSGLKPILAGRNEQRGAGPGRIPGPGIPPIFA